jgi:hypothetical protein
MVEPLLVLAVLVGACVALYVASRPRRKKRDVATLRRELEHLTHDESAAQRLVDAESRRSPDATERELLERVIKRLRYERGR